MLNKLITKIEDTTVFVAIISAMLFAINKISIISEQINYSSVVFAFSVLIGLGTLLINIIIFSFTKTKILMRSQNRHKFYFEKRIIFILWMIVSFTALVAAKFLVIFLEANRQLTLYIILDSSVFKYLFLAAAVVTLVITILFMAFIILNIVLKFQINKMNAIKSIILIGSQKKLIDYECEDSIVKLSETENYLLFFKKFYLSNDSEDLKITTIFSEKLKENKKAQTPPQV